jgi:hypothetical protein
LPILRVAAVFVRKAALDFAATRWKPIASRVQAYGLRRSLALADDDRAMGS